MNYRQVALVLLPLSAIIISFAFASENYVTTADRLTDLLADIESELQQLQPNASKRTRRSVDVLEDLQSIEFDTEERNETDRRSAKHTPETELIGDESNYRLALFQMLTNETGYNISSTRALKLVSTRQSSVCEGNETTCDPASRFRTITGTCNNLANPHWGASSQPFERILPAAYEDFLQEPRGGRNGRYLPNPRKITTTIHYDVISPDMTITNMVPQFGQFLDHDMTLAPEGDRHCCTTERGHPDCWPIPIPLNDPFYSTLRRPQTCMDFTRSTPFCFPANNGERQQFNILTAFVDASQVYGSEDVRAADLREFRGGKLAVHSANPNVLPTVQEIRLKLRKEIHFVGKYLAGDERVNEMPALTTMHMLLVREHNQIADQIQVIRPNWDDEQIYQSARRIMIAEWQNVVYGEYLPVILGPNTMRRYGLELGGFTTYDPAINPTIFHSFATAAYRFGHTLINGIVRLYRGLQQMGSYEVRRNVFESEMLDQNGWDGYNLILGGLMIQNSQKYDPHVTESFTNFLLQERHAEFGADLIARNVHRGREHGIPPYNDFRKVCGLSSLQGWDGKPREILQDTWNRLRSLYQSPADIDLFTGGLSEIPVNDAFSGATFNCLKGMQFRRTLYGDRFFFTHANQPGSFSSEQLANLRGRTLGDIICENSNVDMTTRNVFRVPGASNPHIFCTDPSRNRLNIELLTQNETL